ncbi:P-loop containing nucleoside triphosphate hydrolase protein, partial [Pavlovales sp. CCMP2436]
MVGEQDGAACPCVVVSGTMSGVGKTTVAVGLMLALVRRGLRVQPFKTGPDFLDPLQHTAACGGVPSVNLDPYMLGQAGCQAAFAAACARSRADVAIVEGAMGLHDGVDGTSDEGSTAQVAKWLGAGVVLVIDAWCLSRSAAAMVHGYATFDPEVRLAGVVFNKVGGASHSEWLQQAMASAPSTRNVRVLGSMPKDGSKHVEGRQ